MTNDQRPATNDHPPVAPSQQDALALHARLVAGDPIATKELAEAYLEPLARYLERIAPRADSSDRDTAAEDALISMMKNPQSYDPTRGSLETYLRLAAKRDLQNIRQRERKHSSRRTDWGAVELSPGAGKYLQDSSMDAATVVELNERVRERLRARGAISPAVLHGLSSHDREVLELVRIGERRSDIYAAALGIGHLPVDEQRREVKRAKDRVKKRLERAGGETEHG